MWLIQLLMHVLICALTPLVGTAAWETVPKIPAIDNAIPLLPVFTVFYLYAFIFWLLGPAVVSLTGKRNFHNFSVALLFTYAVSYLILFLFPSGMDRAAEGLIAEAQKPGLFRWFLWVIYSFDGGDKAFNILPSIHCVASVSCYLGMRRQRALPLWVRVFSLGMTVLICLSTVFVKQHFFADMLLGTLLPIPVFSLVYRIDPGQKRYGKAEGTR